MIKATLFLWLAACVIPRLRRRSAAERHLLWAASLAAASLFPLLSLFLPAWQPAWMNGVLAVLPSPLDPVERGTFGQDADIVFRAIGLESGPWLLGDLRAGAVGLRHGRLDAQAGHRRDSTGAARARGGTDGRSPLADRRRARAHLVPAPTDSTPAKLSRHHPGDVGSPSSTRAAARLRRRLGRRPHARRPRARARAHRPRRLDGARARRAGLRHLLVQSPLLDRKGPVVPRKRAGGRRCRAGAGSGRQRVRHASAGHRSRRAGAVAGVGDDGRDGPAVSSRTALRGAVERVRQSRRRDAADTGRGRCHHDAGRSSPGRPGFERRRPGHRNPHQQPPGD